MIIVALIVFFCLQAFVLFCCLAAGKPARTRNYLGLALIPQAGVAIGLAALGARTLGGETGSALETIILASSVLYELIGPACAKLSLYLSHSYGALAPAEAEPAAGAAPQPENEVERLIAQIQQIQRRLPDNAPLASEEEQAFLDAAEEQYAMIASQRKMSTRGRRSMPYDHRF